MATSTLQPRWYHVGPHGFFDLVRLARRGRSAIVRVLYVLALFAGLAIVYYNSQDLREPPPRGVAITRRGRGPAPRDEFIESINRNARIAERFCIAILLMQNIAVLVLTPIYIAASIQEERDKRTFPLLFTTHVTAREIVLGKWLSRCAHVGMVLLGGLPVLSIAQLWGGIDMAMIAVNFCNTAALLLFVGAMSVMIAIRSRSLIRAVVNTYIFLAVAFLFACGPQAIFTGFFVLLLSPSGSGPRNYEEMWILVVALVMAYGFVTVFFLKHSAKCLDMLRTDEGPRFDQEELTGIDAPRNRFWRWPPMSENVIAWKERFLDRNLAIIMPYTQTPFLCALAAAYLGATITDQSPERPSVKDLEGMETVFKLIVLANFFSYLLIVTWRLTGSIVRERQQQTLESLLTLPISRQDLLHQKLIGNLQRQSGWLWPIGFVWLVVMALGQGFALCGFALLIVLVIHLAFFVALGLFLSVHCRTTAIAYGTLGMVLSMLFLGTPLLFSFLGLGDNAWSLHRGLNPAHCWWTISDDWWRKGDMTAANEIGAGVLLYAAAAFTLWLLACRRFERDPV